MLLSPFINRDLFCDYESQVHVNVILDTDPCHICLELVECFKQSTLAAAENRNRQRDTYMNQQDAQNSCDQTLFSIRCSTCFGLCWSIIRSNFISCTSHLVYVGICRYHTSGCGYSHTTPSHIRIYQIRHTTYKKVAPDDGLIYSETCRASNRK